MGFEIKELTKLIIILLTAKSRINKTNHCADQGSVQECYGIRVAAEIKTMEGGTFTYRVSSTWEDVI
jgi:hypothetical protein